MRVWTLLVEAKNEITSTGSSACFQSAGTLFYDSRFLCSSVQLIEHMLVIEEIKNRMKFPRLKCNSCVRILVTQCGAVYFRLYTTQGIGIHVLYPPMYSS